MKFRFSCVRVSGTYGATGTTQGDMTMTKHVIKLAVVGGRNFTDYPLLCREVAGYSPDMIVSGGASGADTLAKRYAEEHHKAYLEFPADWKTYGRAAGPKRNKLIVEECDGLLAFWDGKSRGTANSIQEARRRGKLLAVVMY